MQGRRRGGAGVQPALEGVARTRAKADFRRQADELAFAALFGDGAKTLFGAWVGRRRRADRRSGDRELCGR